MNHWSDLKEQLQRSFESGVSMEDAERWAARCLSAQLDISQELMSADLGARMRKNEYKTMRAKVYLDAVQSADKKPTEAALEAIIATSAEVAATQNAFEEEENASEALERLYDILRDAHIYYRGIAKGAFGG